LPGIREAIEQRDWIEVQKQIVMDSNIITKLAEYLSVISKSAM